MTDDFFSTSAVSDADMREASRHFNLIDAATLADSAGLIPFLADIAAYMNDPMQQHMAAQLYLIAKKYEDILLKYDRADQQLSRKKWVMNALDEVQERCMDGAPYSNIYNYVDHMKEVLS